MKYYVLANRYNEKTKEMEEYVVGEFYSIINARLFKEIYENRYNTTVLIEEQRCRIN